MDEPSNVEMKGRSLLSVLAGLLKEMKRGWQLCTDQKDPVGEFQHKTAWSALYDLVHKYRSDFWDFDCGVLPKPPKPLPCQLVELLQKWKQTAEHYESEGVNNDAALWLRAIGQAVHDAVLEWGEANCPKAAEGQPGEEVGA